MSSHPLTTPSAAHEEPGESAPLWVISFADMVLLVMSFFVLIVASTPRGKTSNSSDAELIKVLASIKAALRYSPDPRSQDPLDRAVLKLLENRGEKSDSDGGKWWKAPGIKGGSPELRELWNKAQATIGEPIPFARGSAEVPADWQWLIDEVAEVVRDHYRILILRGHVSLDEALGELDGGFDLGHRRAQALKQALVDRGISPTRLRLMTCGPHEPMVMREQTEEDRSANRRAEITLGPQFLATGFDVDGQEITAETAAGSQ